MKPLQIVACALTLTLASAVRAAELPPEIQQQVQQYVTEGRAAYQKGDIQGAKMAFQQAYELDSRNTTAIGYLRRIQLDEKNKPKYVPVERQLASLVIPQIQFKEATLGSALDYMKKAADRQSAGKIAVNFVVQLPAEQVNTQQVTLNLSNVPFSEALKYLGTVANLEFVYDKYAIIVKPKADAAPTASTTSPTAPATPTVPGLPGSQ
jgi:hypothetical protein